MKRKEYLPPDKCSRCGGTHTGRNCPFTSDKADEDKAMTRPSIQQLEAALGKDDDIELEILPNGEIREAGGKPSTKKPLTFRENLGGEYGVRW